MRFTKNEIKKEEEKEVLQCLICKCDLTDKLYFNRRGRILCGDCDYLFCSKS